MASFAPEVITTIGNFKITNTLIHTLIVDGLLFTSAFYISQNIKKIPGSFQNLMESIFESFQNLIAGMASPIAAKHIFPFVLSFFLFILVANMTSLFPGFGSIGFFEHSGNDETHLIPLLRGATSDINVTLALAIISVIVTHALSIRLTGFMDYITRFISFNPINLYVGVLELAAELTKVVSLSFRLFGNIYAGEVALATVSKLYAFLFPLPFLLLESIVGVVQALVFSILTLVFMAILTTPHHAHEETKH